MISRIVTQRIHRILEQNFRKDLDRITDKNVAMLGGIDIYANDGVAIMRLSRVPVI